MPGALAVGALDVDDLVALPHRQVDRLMGQLVQLAHRRERRIAHIESRLDQVSHLEHAHPEPITAGFGSIDVATNGQVVEDAVGRRWVETRLLADRFERHGILMRSQQIEAMRRSVQVPGS
jgi:hypothetical protein